MARAGRWFCGAALGALVAAAAAGQEAGDPGADYRVLRGAIHVHTTYSTGRETIRQVAQQARAHGLDVLVITDDDLLEVAYGLPPARSLLRWRRQQPSLLADGTLQQYLSEIRSLDAELEDLIVIDGVESKPYYHWEVDWAQRQWTMRNWNKHLLAVGLGEAQAYRSLPVLGGEGILGDRQVAASWLRLWPLVGLLYALWLGRYHGTLARGGVALVSLVFLGDSLLTGFRVPRFDAYGVDDGAAPYQHYIDAVRQRGGLVFWAHPESGSTIPPETVLAGAAAVRLETSPHAGDLVDTREYTGFAGLYADHITATEPGHEWDQVLIDYLQGRRAQPAWATGEVDYHLDVEGNRIHDIQTVMWVRQATREQVLEALARGRIYAVRGGDQALALTAWSVTAGSQAAVSGEEIEVAPGATWRVSAGVEKVNGSGEEVWLRLVGGAEEGAVSVVAEVQGPAPLRLEHLDKGGRGQERRYYRLLARSRTSFLTSNPIFLREGSEPGRVRAVGEAEGGADSQVSTAGD